MTYDVEEAKLIAARLAHRLDPNQDAERQAVDDLLRDVEALLNPLGFVSNTTSKGEVTTTTIQFSRRPYHLSVLVVSEDKGDGRRWSAYWKRHTGSEEREASYPLALRFNPIDKSYEGSANDSFLVPEPGKPRSGRAAPAVIVEGVAEAFFRALKLSA